MQSVKIEKIPGIANAAFFGLGRMDSIRELVVAPGPAETRHLALTYKLDL
jgi:hypothetical protein